ncbi:MAG: hypothetical protein ABIF82_09040 [Planctomycetota bacterium]
MAGTISGPEARRILAGAQKNLYTDREHGTEPAIRLADSVIHDCSVRRYVWRGFVLKATAYAAAGNHTGAERTAHEGIQTIMAIHQGPLDGDAWTAARMLLPMYVEGSIGAEDHRSAVTTLRAWRTELLARYRGGEKANREEKANIEGAFDLLEQMAEQGVASRQSESRLKLLVLKYIQLYNNGSLAGASALFVAEAGRPDHVTRLLARRNKSAAGADRLYIVSAVNVHVPAGAPPGVALSAEAVCDLMAASPAGWARVIKGVRFVFAGSPTGKWLIKDIIGHP